MNIDHEMTKTIIEWFEKVNEIPRCSKNEKAICEWLAKWAEENGFSAKTDKVENLLIEVPASPGYENSPVVVLQGHMDMVCEKTKGSNHDFEKDPIPVRLDDGWLKAESTTLGADNGIAIAMALALALDKNTPHPPLEFLFTVDEETGLTGATALESDFLKGRILLNIDSEDEGVFTVGCAGGKDASVTIPFNPVTTPDGYKSFKIIAGGMSGGHSGVDIHEQRANAIKILTRTLHTLMSKGDLRLASIEGGSAHNAIPRDAEAVVFMPAAAADLAKQLVDKLSGVLAAEHAKTDPNLSLMMVAAAGENQVLTTEETRRVIDFLLAYPHGVAFMSNDIEGLVETSDNLATVKTGASKIEILSSQRSSNMDKLNFLTDQIAGLARLAGAEVEIGDGYPAWKPNMDSKLLVKCKEVFMGMFGKEPIVEIIHAGLECGIIGAKYDGMDMISIGPTIKNPHSPDEMIDVESIGKFWDFLAALLKSIK
ncbi:MAG: aminoacyl-histidine dipeptidase [Deltaproteobacteria bacterium]|nr:aminoacyl-histidine dipeptidase [Deltaproteobacteria bacterium]